jgi:hypothetical protein
MGRKKYSKELKAQIALDAIKSQKIFLEEFETVPKLLAGLKEYFEFYNFERPHQSFSGKTPATTSTWSPKRI